MAKYCVGITMETDWGETDSRTIDRALVRRVLAYFRPYWRAGALALACLAVGALLGLVPALVFKSLIDTLAAESPDFGHVALLVGAGIGAAIVAGLVALAESYLSERISQGIIFDLREQLFDKLVHQSVGFYTHNRAGEVMSRIGNDVNDIENVVADTVFGFANNALIAGTTLGLMIAFDWRLTLVALVLIPAIALPMRTAGRRVYGARGATQRKLADMTAYLQEVLGISSALLAKAFGREGDERARFRATNDELRRLEIHASMISRRFYDPRHGRVLIDGHDVRDLTLESLRRHIGIVFQDTFLFHASIRDNLRYARPDASDDDLITAARAAYMHGFIASLPDGYDTVVGERGHRLSGGEKQRIAIARVILKDPRILVLDEATSNLDTVSEQFIQAALKPLFEDRTSVVIAHRLSTILAADLILVLDRGRLVERGTHTDLLDQAGLYATLYEHQFRAEPVTALSESR